MKKTEVPADMDNSWLVQRLQRPRRVEGKLATIAEMFAFGGGMKNGGLSEDAMKLLRDIWQFDYMGAAEFEFGEVPKALNKMANTPLVAFKVEVATDDVTETHPWSKEEKQGVVKGTVYGLCKPEWVDEVKKRIIDWAKAEYPRKRKRYQGTKETVGLERALRDPGNIHGAMGWLELDNGYLFFLDKEMFDKTAKLFGVETKDLGDAA